VKDKVSHSFYFQVIINRETIERTGKKMSKHVALFSVYNTYDADKYNILALFPDNETPELSELSHILYKKNLEELEDEDILKVVEVFKTLKNEGEKVHIEHLNANCRLEWIETGQVIGDQ
jgi:hypothetical protein